MNLWRRLTPLYEPGEAQAIVRLVLEQRFCMSWSDIVCGKADNLSASDKAEMEHIMLRLEQGEPVQYVLGETVFCGHPFHVEPGVLIPRPETEELVRWIVEEGRESRVESQESRVKSRGARGEGRELRQKILDIGTGSGCIAISLAMEMEDADVEAWDISEKALMIAQANAEALGAKVHFIRQDILNFQPSTLNPQPSTLDSQPSTLNPRPSTFSIIVSNPPYICKHERSGMDRNVLEYEPAEALFVSDHDPLCFYRAISHFAMKTLKTGGELYFEINPLYAEALKALQQETGWTDIEIRKDQFGKLRMMKSVKP